MKVEALNGASFHLKAELHHHARISFTAVTKVERRCSTQVTGVTTMDVNVLPLSVALMPNSSLL